jgi:hypothetical protein
LLGFVSFNSLFGSYVAPESISKRSVTTNEFPKWRHLNRPAGRRLRFSTTD